MRVLCVLLLCSPPTPCFVSTSLSLNWVQSSVITVSPRERLVSDGKHALLPLLLLFLIPEFYYLGLPKYLN